MDREESQARGAPTRYTTTASASSATDQLAHTNGDDRQAEGAHAAAAPQATGSPANPGLQPPSTTTTTTTASTRPKQHKHVAERPGKLHTRVPSYRGKQHHNAPPKPKLVSRKSYHHPEDAQPTYTTSRHTHRRAHSDLKLVGDDASIDLIRNRSHQDITKRNKSFDKLRAQASAMRSRSHAGSPADQPTQSALARRRDDEGEEEVDDDEWVDDSANASTTASPFPRTPREPQKHPRASALSPVEAGGTPSVSSADRDIAQHKEYLTSRLLRRVPSHNVPPQVSAAMASSAPRDHRNSPDTTISQDSTAPATPNAVSGGEEDEGLTSRFLTRSGSTFTREGSFYTSGTPAIAGRSLDDAALRRPRSMMDLARDDTSPRRDASAGEGERNPRRRAPPAEISRTQQKLNLQRASSVIEPQPLNPAPTMMGPAAALAGVPAPGYDGVSRDPRLPRLMEKTGMEFRVVRRYQNPVLRSITRLDEVPGWGAQRAPRGGHARNSSLPPLRDGGTRPSTPMRAQSSRGLARSGLVGAEGLLRKEGDAAVAAALRNLWEKPLDLSASQ